MFLESLRALERRLESGQSVSIYAIARDLKLEFRALRQVIEQFPALGKLIRTCKVEQRLLHIYHRTVCGMDKFLESNLPLKPSYISRSVGVTHDDLVAALKRYPSLRNFINRCECRRFVETASIVPDMSHVRQTSKAPA